MRHFPAVAFMTLGMAIAASAQHGASHPAFAGHGGAPSGHIGGAPRGGFPAGPPRSSSGLHGGFGASPRPSFPLRSQIPGRPISSGPRSAYRGITDRRPDRGSSDHDGDRGRFRRPYRRNRNSYPLAYWNAPYAIPYAYPYYGGWLDSEYSDDSSDENTAGAQPYPGENYGSQLDGSPQDTDPASYSDSGQNSDPSQPWGPYQPSPTYPAARPPYTPSAPLPTRSATTLIYKDGRPAEQIQNYLLSRSTLTVLDEHPREIAVDQLDLPATQQANRAAGIEFHLPAAK